MRRLPMADGGDTRAWSRYWLLALGLALAGVAGYLGYVAYPRFDLPAGTGAGLLVLAAAAGVAAFFSPCSFPLLVTLLSREASTGGRPAAEAAGRPAGGTVARSLGVAFPLSAGAVVFVLGLGALIALGGRGLAGGVTFTSTTGIVLRIVVGAFLILLGLVQAELVPVTFHDVGDRMARPIVRAQARLRRRRPRAGLAAFGFGYLLAGFG